MAYKEKESTSDCLRKFVVNLVRPSDFKGEYGFSSVDASFVNKVVPLATRKKDKPIRTQGDIILRKVEAKISSQYTYEKKELITEFKDENGKAVYGLNAIERYKKLYNSRFNCSPWGFNYLTTYSSLFPKNNINNFKSEMVLDVELSQLRIYRDDDLPLSPDGTIIEFLTDHKNINIHPNKINIGQLIKKREKRNYTPNDKDESKNFYLTKKILKISCLGTIEKACTIKIMATRNGVSKQVGLHVIVKNDKPKKAKIKIVDVVYDDRDVFKYSYKELQNKIKYQCLNQALICAEFEYEKFPLNKFMNKHNVIKFIKDYPKNKLIDEQNGDGFYFVYYPQLKKIYEECRLNNKSVDSDSGITYLFRTILEVEGSEDRPDYGIGMSSVIVNGNHPNHLSSCIVSGNSRYFEPMHELCHSFGLMHLFEEDYNYKNRPTIRQGYSPNLMDYRENIIDKRNKYSNNMFVLEFWQWSDLSKDKNLR